MVLPILASSNLSRRLYTVLMDYGGGTYISQVLAPSVSSALQLWLDQLTDDELANWTLKRSELEDVVSKDAVALESLESIWCVSSTGDLGLIPINIVCTQTAIES